LRRRQADATVNGAWRVLQAGDGFTHERTCANPRTKTLPPGPIGPVKETPRSRRRRADATVTHGVVTLYCLYVICIRINETDATIKDVGSYRLTSSLRGEMFTPPSVVERVRHPVGTLELYHGEKWTQYGRCGGDAVAMW